MSVVLLAVTTVFAQAPQKFKYQAVARDASGLPLPSQDVSLRLSILQGSEVGASVYSEIHSVTTNEFGLINLNIGEGTTSDDFSSINWGSASFFVQVEMDIANGSNFTEAGTSELLSVPYALYSNESGSSTSETWQLTGQNIYYDSGNVGIGTQTPDGKFVVQASSSSLDTDVLFEVKDKDGNSVMQVTSGGVRINVKDGGDDTRGAAGGFAVGRIGTARSSSTLMKVTSDSIRLYVGSGDRASAGGFAVGRIGTARTSSDEFLRVTPDSVRVYINFKGCFWWVCCWKNRNCKSKP